MTDIVPASREVSDDEFPSFGEDDEPTIRICSEPDCGEPCIKRGRGYAWYCADHLHNHTVEPDKKISSRSDRIPNSRKELSTDKIAAKATNQVSQMLGMVQLGFVIKQDVYCANAINIVGPDIAKSAGMVAADFKFMAKVIDKGDKYFALAYLGVSLGKLGLMMGVHHDVIPYTGPIKLLVPEPPQKDHVHAAQTTEPAYSPTS